MGDYAGRKSHVLKIRLLTWHTRKCGKTSENIFSEDWSARSGKKRACKAQKGLNLPLVDLIM